MNKNKLPIVGRVGEKRAFEEAVWEAKKKRKTVIVWHGLAGQGKSVLASEIHRMMSTEVEPSFGHLRRGWLSFRDFSYADPLSTLVRIRNSFYRSGLTFPAFDLAFPVIWQKVRGEQVMPAFDDAWIRPIKEGSSEATADIVTITREFVEVAMFPALGFLVKGTTKWAFDRAHKWKVERARPFLAKLYDDRETVLDDNDLVNLLPWILAQDINAYSVENPLTLPVLLIDEYDRLLEMGGLGDLITRHPVEESIEALIEACDSILVCIFSRELLDQASLMYLGDATTRVRLPGLRIEDAFEILDEVAISDEGVRDTIVQNAKDRDVTDQVYPLLLALQIQHVNASDVSLRASDLRLDEPSMIFRLRTIVSQILRYYPEPTREIIRRLSLLNSFDISVADYVRTEFNIPVSSNIFVELQNSSLTNDPQRAGRTALRRPVAEILRETLPQEMFRETARALVSFLKDKANPAKPVDVSEEIEEALFEAARIRKMLGAEGYAEWLEEAAAKVMEARRQDSLRLLWQEALDFCLRELGEENIEVARCNSVIGRLYAAENKVEDAKPFFKKALEIRVRIRGELSEEVAESYRDLAFCLFDRANPNEAHLYESKALAIRKKVHGERSAPVAQMLVNIAADYDATMRFDVSEKLLDDAISIYEEVVGRKNPETMNAIANYAVNLNATGRASKAEKLLIEVLSFRQDYFGEVSFEVGETRQNLGVAYREQRKFVQAERELKRALKIFEQVNGQYDVKCAHVAENIVMNLFRAGRVNEIRSWLLEIQRTYEMALGKGHPDATKARSHVERFDQEIGASTKSSGSLEQQENDGVVVRFPGKPIPRK